MLIVNYVVLLEGVEGLERTLLISFISYIVMNTMVLGLYNFILNYQCMHCRVYHF